jgi:hypothetical protein
MAETESTTDEVTAAVIAALGLPSGFAGCARENSAAPVVGSRVTRHRAVRSFTVVVLNGDGSEEGEDVEEEAVGCSDVLMEEAGSEHRPEAAVDPAHVAAWDNYWLSCEPNVAMEYASAHFFAKAPQMFRDPRRCVRLTI